MKNSTIYIIGGVSALLLGIGTVAYLKRKEISLLSRKATAMALAEFNDWNKGGIKRKEGDSSMYDKIKTYWNEGTDTFWSKQKMIDEAWSAAFISYLMKKSGAGSDFKYSNSHSVYITDAIKNRLEQNKKKFKGFKPSEVKVEKGDLICYARQGGVSYDTKGQYISHCDLVVNVNNNKATSIGGNVSNSVSKTVVNLDKNNKIIDDKYFVVIKNG